MLATAGAEVLVNDLLEERTQKVVGGDRGRRRPRPLAPFDVTDYDAVKAAIDAAGPVDILVNNAGNAGRDHLMGSFDLSTFVETDPAVVGPVHQDQLLRRDEHACTPRCRR